MNTLNTALAYVITTPAMYIVDSEVVGLAPGRCKTTSLIEQQLQSKCPRNAPGANSTILEFKHFFKLEETFCF
jgi:hypothetical protein